jgi:hypothetical protein
MEKLAIRRCADGLSPLSFISSRFLNLEAAVLRAG